ncbi:MAG: hypothetical protein DI627_00270 [Acinetobacter sp.]|nr:MAG: hypothetical protein DI627_00270 [Acinetobacter sp.]
MGIPQQYNEEISIRNFYTFVYCIKTQPFAKVLILTNKSVWFCLKALYRSILNELYLSNLNRI